MSALLSTPLPPAQPSLREAADVSTSPQERRLAHLFRTTLRLGRIHPLYLPMLKYRQARAERHG